MILRRTSVTVLALSVALLSCAPARAQTPKTADAWSQWRGPTRDGVAPPQPWSWKWSAEGPRKVWTANVGQGYASLIASGGRIFAFGRVSEKAEGKKWVELVGDCVQCLDADTGKVLWRTCVGKGRGEFVTSTPCTDGKRVFAATWEGNVTALEADTGAVVWQVDVVKEHGTSRGGFHGIANSPLLAGDVLVLAQGLGLDKNTGKLVWQTRDAMSRSHASPVQCAAGDQPGVIMYGKTLMRLNPSSGAVLWQLDKPWDLGQGYMDPIVMGSRILVLDGSRAFRFRFTATSVADDNKGLFRGPWGYAGAGDLANPVTWKGHLYAPRISSSDRSGLFADNPDLSLSRLECFDLETLEKRWSHPGIAGTPIVCDGKLIIQGQWGELRVAEASPEGYVELANARISEPRSGQHVNPFGRASWATPVLLNGRVYCRFFPGDVVCLDVSRDDPTPDPLAGKRRIVGELCTVTGTLSAKPADAPNDVVGLLAEDAPPAGVQRTPAVYTLCALKHNDNPGHIEKIAGFVDRGGRVSVTGTLMYENRLSVNGIASANP